MKTNLQAAIAFVNAEISIGKFFQLVTERHDQAELLRGIAQAAMFEIPKQNGGLPRNYVGQCCRCHKLVFLRRAPKHAVYCGSEECRALQKKIREMDSQKPVSLDSVNADFTHSPVREINAYNGCPG